MGLWSGVSGKLLPLGAAAVVAFGCASKADAALIIQSESFSTTAGVAIVGFQEFDPDLGTLDSVLVAIVGNASISLTALPFTAVFGGLHFDAVGAGGRGFDYLTPGHVQNASLFNGGDTQITQVFLQPFAMDFTLNATTDLAGFAVANTVGMIAPPVVDAQRADFIEGLAAIGISETLIFSTDGSAVNPTVEGAVFLTYNYTPAVVTPVPAPATMGIFLAGLAGLGFCRRQSVTRG